MVSAVWIIRTYLLWWIAARTIRGGAYRRLTARFVAVSSEDATGPVEFRLLGPLEVVIGRTTLPVGGPRQRALLAFLLLHANRTVRRETLIDALWGEEPPPTAQNALQVAVHGLRRLLGAERIETVGEAYRLRVEPGELDLERFLELAERAPGEALALWLGPPLADVDAPYVAAEAARLDDLRLAAMEAHVESELAAGRHEPLVPELERLIAAHPYRERLRAQHMLALYGAGRQAEALDAYRAARRVLVDQLGIEPGPDLQELERAILRHDPELAPTPVATEFPATMTPLVGRELVLAAVAALLHRPEVRLLTLTGPGGTGKTRLALEAARQLAAGGDAAIFVDLAPLAHADLVLGAIAEALGAQPTVPAVRARIGAQALLLLLDNFERVDTAAPAVGQLLAAAPSLRVLATSRSPLHVTGEHVYEVPPLVTPARGAEHDLDALARNEAVQLFVARAQASLAELRLEADAAAIAQICRLVDGLPLALELAAARVRFLSPRELLGRLTRRLDVLTEGPRDAPARQRALRSTIDWSHDLLSQEEQQLFRRLAVFAGGASLDAVEHVCGGSLAVLSVLVDQSLVRRSTAASGQARFDLLQTIAEYAQERLDESGESDRLAASHADYYLALAEEAAPRLLTADGAELLAALDVELDNVRAALATSRSLGPPERHLRVAGDLWRFWYVRGYLAEGRRWLESALAEAGAQPATVRAAALRAAAILATEHGDLEEGQQRASEALALYRDLEDERGVLTALTVLGNAARGAGSLGLARASFEESGTLAQELGLTEDVGVAVSNLAAVAIVEEEYERARELLVESLAISREVGRQDAAAIALASLGYVRLRGGQHDAAADALAESLEISWRLGFRATALTCLVNLAAVAAACAEYPEAATLLGAAVGVAGSADEPLEPLDRTLIDELAQAAREHLGDAVFEAAWTRGYAAPDEVVADVLAARVD
jgi:predicted ATPase/DNA-binding SARP family transcriptional activator